MTLPDSSTFLRIFMVDSIVATMIQTLLCARNRPTQILLPNFREEPQYF
jgi:hypothetical protein